ncbi:UBC-like protein [Sistotremastrum suecicum HHB10207 ss-3]|uniref:UBC-like protein n=1 Tax=Sistotremastrum suecicum HHB10207 ss-3 TaxID=1314776 RepID=A0A166IXC2_9AGAM|nr:UBC-like protein [Sistotremastrum suecicum HHB10207 ss-3]
MATATAYNKNNAGVKRILREAAELAADPSTDYYAQPLETDIFEWHCTMRGPPGTEFEGGLYHFRIILPAEYPFRPPSIVMLTPSGRFECGTKICISFTNYHEELWQPAWGVRTAIIGLQGFFPLKGEAAVGLGAVDYPPNERRRLAQLSREWTCPDCHEQNIEILPDPANPQLISPPSPPPSSITPANTEPKPSEPEPTPALEAPAPSAESSPELQPESSTPTSEASLESLSPPPSVATPASPPQQTVLVSSPSSSPRPPLLLDATICVLLVLVAALICRRIF